MEANNNSETSNESIPARFAELKELVSNMEKDFQKFYSQGNKAAGTRVRAAMQGLKTFAQSVRSEVQGLKNDKKPDAEA